MKNKSQLTRKSLRANSNCFVVYFFSSYFPILPFKVMIIVMQFMSVLRHKCILGHKNIYAGGNKLYFFYSYLFLSSKRLVKLVVDSTGHIMI